MIGHALRYARTAFSPGQPVCLAPLDHRDWLILAALLVVGLVVRVSVAWLFPSIYHPDEVFQYWEQGYRFAFGQGMVPWEYRLGIRSYLIPGALAGIVRLVDDAGGGMEAWRIAIQTVLSLLSLFVVATAYLWARRNGGRHAAILAGVIASTWFELIYFSGKPLTESVAAAFLFPAAYLLCASRHKGWLLATGGVLLGLTFVVRFHLAPAIGVLAIACVATHGWRRSIPAAGGAILVILLGGVLDWITLGLPWQSVWLNYITNAVHDKASSFGVQPFYWYLLFYLNAWPGFIIPLVLLACAGVRRAPVLLTVFLAIVLAHSAIGHKEHRFVYPALPFLLTLASIGTISVFNQVAPVLFIQRVRTAYAVMIGLWVLASVNLAAQDGFRGNFLKASAPIEAFKVVRSIENMCGLGIAGLGWVDTPGYQGLGADVPIYPLRGEEDANRLHAAFDVVVKRGSDWPVLNAYEQIGCADSICVAKRPGPCTPQPEYTINPYLVRTNQ